MKFSHKSLISNLKDQYREVGVCFYILLQMASLPTRNQLNLEPSMERDRGESVKCKTILCAVRESMTDILNRIKLKGSKWSRKTLIGRYRKNGFSVFMLVLVNLIKSYM